jgi:hypothetical protein
MTYNDLTILYYTANIIPEHFMLNIQNQIKNSVGDTKIISVSQKPVGLGYNICYGTKGRSLFNLYQQILIAVREAHTSYVACCEDDTLYPPEHFEHRCPLDMIAYDINKYTLMTWRSDPIFTLRPGRRTMSSMIGSTKVLLDTLEERYDKYPSVEVIPPDIYKYYWGEPGRFENHALLTPIKTEVFEAKIPHIQFSTPESMGFGYLGTRKALGPVQSYDLPLWGNAKDALKLYKEVV